MPRRKKRTKRRTRKPIGLLRSPIPLKMVTKFRYQENISLDPPSSVADTYVFSANGLYDPNITGVGHQPRGFDQFLGVLYDHYVVLGSKITCKFTSGDGSYDEVVALALRDDSAGSTQVNDYMESSNSVNRIITNVTTGGNDCTGTLSMKFNNRFLGRSHPLSDPDLKGGSASNPTEQAYYHICAQPFIGGINPGKVWVSVQIDYIVALIEPRVPGQS